jgi:hypothetical protein
MYLVSKAPSSIGRKEQADSNSLRLEVQPIPRFALDLPSISFRNSMQAHHGSLNSTALTAAFVFHHVAPQERHL